MTPEDLRRIEKAIGRPLSDAVRQFFLHYPPELRSTVRDFGDDDEGNPYTECPADNELCDSADALMALNDRSVGWMADFPRNMLIVGSGGCGETYWVDLDNAAGAVYRFESGSPPDASDPMAESLAEFARGLIEVYRNG